MSKGGSLYYASDKALYDALRQGKFKKEDLRSLFLSRGILFSNETEKASLAKTFSRINHDYYDHVQIAQAINSIQRKERVSLTSMKNMISEDDLEKSVNDFRGVVEDLGDRVDYQITKRGIDITVGYTHVDYNKTEFKQVVDREASISIELNEDGMVIRSPLNDYVDEIKEHLLDSISEQGVGELSYSNIELSSISNPTKRSDFFIKLTNSIESTTCHDVTDVYVFHPKKSSDDEDELEDSSDLGVHISKATLKGEGVLESQELISLYAKGFYIWKIVWVVSEGVGKDRFVIEAQFADAENCRKFSYLLKGVQKPKASGGYCSGTRALNSLEELKYSRLIEAAAKVSLNEVIASELDERNADESG